MNEQEWEDTYRQLDRAAGMSNIMATGMEGRGKLAQIQKRLQRRDEEVIIQNRFNTYFQKIREFFETKAPEYVYLISDRNEIINSFNSLDRREYRNIYAYILGYIYDKSRNIELIRQIIKYESEINPDVSMISDIDVIRYYRLYNLQNR